MEKTLTNGSLSRPLDRTVVYIAGRPDAIIVMDEYHRPFICGSVMVHVTDIEGESFGEVYVSVATFWMAAMQRMEIEFRGMDNDLVVYDEVTEWTMADHKRMMERFKGTKEANDEKYIE